VKSDNIADRWAVRMAASATDEVEIEQRMTAASSACCQQAPLRLTNYNKQKKTTSLVHFTARRCVGALL